MSRRRFFDSANSPTSIGLSNELFERSDPSATGSSAAAYGQTGSCCISRAGPLLLR
jgi:hypothetical protein